MPKSIKFDVFGRRILTIRSEKGWQLFHLSGDGKRHPADELIVPPFVTGAEADLVDVLRDKKAHGPDQQN